MRCFVLHLALAFQVTHGKKHHQRTHHRHHHNLQLPLQLPRTSVLQVPAPREGFVLRLALVVQVTCAQQHRATPRQTEQQDGGASQCACRLGCKVWRLGCEVWMFRIEREHRVQKDAEYLAEQSAVHNLWPPAWLLMAQMWHMPATTDTYGRPTLSFLCLATHKDKAHATPHPHLQPLHSELPTPHSPHSPTPTATSACASSGAACSPALRMMSESGTAPSTGSTTPPMMPGLRISSSSSDPAPRSCAPCRRM